MSRGNSLSCTRGGFDLVLGKISSLKGLPSTGTGCPGRWSGVTNPGGI